MNARANRRAVRARRSLPAGMGCGAVEGSSLTPLRGLVLPGDLTNGRIEDLLLDRGVSGELLDELPDDLRLRLVRPFPRVVEPLEEAPDIVVVLLEQLQGVGTLVPLRRFLRACHGRASSMWERSESSRKEGARNHARR